MSDRIRERSLSGGADGADVIFPLCHIQWPLCADIKPGQRFRLSSWRPKYPW